jgi:hypothetical protein
MRATAAPTNATFFAPNHPEFFTDWMLDKEILSRSAPLAACWATNSIVNGMGVMAQRFWLRNNLIAQIPGASGGAAKAHSIAWAAKGHGVLLHPEGTVGWHGDRIGRLFPGAVEMAAEAARLQQAQGNSSRALVQPIVWKLVFTEDAMDGLSREMTHIETQLGLGTSADRLSRRILNAYQSLLERDAMQWDLTLPPDDSFDARQRSVLGQFANRLRIAIEADVVVDLSGTADPEPRMRPLLRAVERALRQPGALAEDRRTEIKGLAGTARKILRFRPSLYPSAELTQEHLAENIKRLRGDYCSGTFADRFDRMVPRPAAPRIAHIRVPEAVDVGVAFRSAGARSEAQVDTLVAELRQRMQAALDGINASVGSQPRTTAFANPFHG